MIEAGYPNSSPEDFEAVSLVAREIEGPAICALSRASSPRISLPAEKPSPRLAEAGFIPASAPRTNTSPASSATKVRQHTRRKANQDLALAVDAVKLAREFMDDVEFYAEDPGGPSAIFL